MSARNKYGAKRTAVGNITFASVAEAKRYGELLLLERGGYIRNLELQPVYPIVIDGKTIAKYIADFRYFEGCTRVVEDVKSKPTMTAVFNLKKKLVESLYPGTKIMVVQA